MTQEKRDPESAESIQQIMMAIDEDVNGQNVRHERIDEGLARTGAILAHIRAQPHYLSLYASELTKVSETYMELCCDKPYYDRLMVEGLQRLDEVGEHDSRELIAVLGYLSTAYTHHSQFEDALQCRARANQMQMRLGGDEGERMNTLNEIAILYSRLGQLRFALDHNLQALDIAEQHNNEVGATRSHNNLCLRYSQLEEYDHAITHGEAALSVEESPHHNDEERTLLRTLRGYSLNNLGRAWMGKGALSTAQNHFERGLAHNKEHNRWLGQIYSLRGLGNVALQQGRSQDAVPYLEEAVQLSEQINHDLERSTSMQLLAAAYAAAGKHEKAYHQYEQFHALYSDVHEAKWHNSVVHWQTRLETETAHHNTQIMRLKNEELEAVVAERTAEVLKALEQSERANVVRSNMLKTIMHEFRTPLTVISSSSGLLKRHSAKMSAEKQEQMHTRITDSIQYLSTLLDEVSKVENSSTGNLEPQFSMVAIGKWSKKLVNYLRRETADPANVTYIFDAADETPIEIDTGMTKAIALELVTNGIKYTPDEKPITVEISMNDGNLVVTVSDEGMGIAAGEIDKIYELFYRAYKAGDIPGLGTGLYVIKAMVNALDGEIDVKSDGVGLGTVFSLKLPNPSVS